ncbi:MAG: hypothetical protein KJN71_06765, partial [Acidimicrobiia bacterium]|nr:hypothetical protein [Acidimicrobiia bacterium]
MKRAILIVVVAATACSSPAVAPPAETTTTAPAGSSTTTVTPNSTSTAPPPTTTTTAPAPPRRIELDRSDDATASRLEADADALLTIGVREAGTAAEAETADWLARSLRAAGLAVTVETVPLPNDRESQNVIARLGTGESHVVIGGHMDTIVGSPGLDD